MHALRIPTTRSLSLIDLPDLPVVRERLEHASIATRLAPSFLRIGNFETFNPPMDVFFLFGGGAGGGKDWEGMRILGEWVAEKVLKIGLEAEGDKGWGKRLVFEVARRNAEMLGGWQAYGFMVCLLALFCLILKLNLLNLAWCDEYRQHFAPWFDYRLWSICIHGRLRS